MSHDANATLEAIKRAARQELLMELIEKAKESARVSSDVDEMSYRTDMGWLNDLEEMAGLPKTDEV
jgi:hypothetical protein